MDKKTTNELLKILNETKQSDLDGYFARYSDTFVGERVFTDYMKDLFHKKKISQQDVFRKAGIPEKYGYRLISGERVTRQRDVLLRICIAAKFTLKEAQQALKYYQMPELYARFPRDAVFIIALNTQIGDVVQVDEMLEQHQMPGMVPCGKDED